MTVQWRDSLDEPHIRQLHLLYQSEWWTTGRDLAGVCLMLEQTPVLVAGVEEETDRLVAFARVLTDGVYRAVLLDVIVAADCRGQGLGIQLLERALAHPLVRGAKKIDLNCKLDMVPLYERFGFEVQDGPDLLMRRTGSPDG